MKRRFWSSMSLALALLWLLGCPELRRAEPPNVVLIVIDTLRADRLSFYGNELDTAPFLSGLAERAVVFESALSPSGWTAPATASLFTSLYPNQHHVWTGFRASEKMGLRYNRIPDEAETIPEMMLRLGYRTFGVADNINISEEMGFSRGFDRFARHPYESARVLQQSVREWSAEITSGSRYFLYLHFIDPHTPYRNRADYFVKGSSRNHRERLEQWQRGTPRQRGWVGENLDRYDSEIGLVDRVISELYESLGWDENTLVVLTSDHGEEFYDHGDRYHGDRLYGELTRVPMLAYFPERFGPSRISANVGLVDVMPTLRELLGEAPDSRSAGRSLLPLLESGEDPGADRTYFGLYRNETPDLEQGVSRRSVVEGRWKYIRLMPEEREELYDLEADPWEQRDLAAEHPELVRKLRRQLREFEAQPAPFERSYFDVERQSEEMNRHLRALGYVE